MTHGPCNWPNESVYKKDTLPWLRNSTGGDRFYTTCEDRKSDEKLVRKNQERIFFLHFPYLQYFSYQFMWDALSQLSLMRKISSSLVRTIILIADVLAFVRIWKFYSLSWRRHSFIFDFLGKVLNVSEGLDHFFNTL